MDEATLAALRADRRRVARVWLTTALELVAAAAAVTGDVLLFAVTLPGALLVSAVILFAASWALSR